MSWWAECCLGQTPHCCICVTGKHLASAVQGSYQEKWRRRHARGFSRHSSEKVYLLVQTEIFQRWVGFREFFLPFHCDCKPGEVPAVSICFSFWSLAHWSPWEIYAKWRKSSWALHILVSTSFKSVTSVQFGSLQQDFLESFEWQFTQQATLKSFDGCSWVVSPGLLSYAVGFVFCSSSWPLASSHSMHVLSVRTQKH